MTDGPESSRRINISPSKNEILFFFGVKILRVSEGRLMPLWHGSVAEPGEARRAQVAFYHAIVDPPVTHARSAYER